MQALPIDILIPSKGRHGRVAANLPVWSACAERWGGRVLLCDQSPTVFEPTDADPRLLIDHAPGLAGLPAARNRLLRTSHAPVVLFIDDDLTLQPAFAGRLLRTIRQHPSAVAWGPMIEWRHPREQRLYRLSQWGSCRDPRRLCWSRQAYQTRSLFGCCFAVRRSQALRTGFDERMRGYALGEDHDFFLRLPGSKILAPDLACRHAHEVAPPAAAHRLARAKAHWLVRLARHHGQHNPATLFHLALALIGAASGAGRDPSTWQGVITGLLSPEDRSL